MYGVESDGVFLYIDYGIVQAMHEGGSEMISYTSVPTHLTSCCKMSQVVARCLNDVENKCEMFHLALSLESVQLAF